MLIIYIDIWAVGFCMYTTYMLTSHPWVEVPKFSGPTWPMACWSEAPRQPKLTEHPKNCLEVEFHLFSFPFWITSWQVRACSFGKCINKEAVQDILREQVLRGEPCFGPIQDTCCKNSWFRKSCYLVSSKRQKPSFWWPAGWLSGRLQSFMLKLFHWKQSIELIRRGNQGDVSSSLLQRLGWSHVFHETWKASEVWSINFRLIDHYGRSLSYQFLSTPSPKHTHTHTQQHSISVELLFAQPSV